MLDLDASPVGTQIAPTRKNALFARNKTGAENWALLASPVTTCTMSGPNPVDYPPAPRNSASGISCPEAMAGLQASWHGVAQSRLL